MSYRVLVVSSEADTADDLLEMAWGLIANAWDVADQVKDWKPAAERWREEWFNFRAEQLDREK